MPTLTNTVSQSTDDAALDDIVNYDDAGTYIFWGNPGSPLPVDCGQGLRFTNVLLAPGDTINGVTIKQMKTVTEWITIPWRLTAINEDNTATFSAGSPPGSRPIVTASIAAETVNVNHVDGTVYTFPTTVGLQTTLAAAVQAVINRAGWASGNALAVVNQSDQDASAQSGFARETYHTFDAAVAASEPQLVVDYTAGVGGGGPVFIRRRRTPSQMSLLRR